MKTTSDASAFSENNNMGKIYTVAVVGCGWMGLGASLDPIRLKPASHAEAIAMNPRTKLVAMVDMQDDALEWAKKIYPNIPLFKEVEPMLEATHPDIVIIATTPEAHCPAIKASARAKVPAVFCEKPIAHSLPEAKEAVELCQQSGTKLFVNHVRRFDPLIRKFRNYVRNEYVRDTFIGKIRSAVSHHHKGLFYSTTHNIDLLRFFLGEAKWVIASENKNMDHVQGDLSIDAMIGFEDVVAALPVYDTNMDYKINETIFFGERGRMTLRKMTGLEIEIAGVASTPEFSGSHELDYGKERVFGEPRSFLIAPLQHIIDCLDGKDEPVSTGEDELKTLAILSALQQSAQQDGKRIYL